MVKNDFRVPSIFKIIIRICMKNVEFCGKASTFLPKICLFIFCIFLKSKRFKPTSMSNKNKIGRKYVENKFSNSTSHKNQKKKKREREGQRRAKTLSNFKNVCKTPSKFSLFKLVTNYHFYHLWSHPDKNL